MHTALTVDKGDQITVHFPKDDTTAKYLTVKLGKDTIWISRDQARALRDALNEYVDMPIPTDAK